MVKADGKLGCCDTFRMPLGACAHSVGHPGANVWYNVCDVLARLLPGKKMSRRVHSSVGRRIGTFIE